MGKGNGVWYIQESTGLLTSDISNGGISEIFKRAKTFAPNRQTSNEKNKETPITQRKKSKEKQSPEFSFLSSEKPRMVF